MSAGWIPAWRKLRDSAIGPDLILSCSWMYLLMEAQWEPKKLPDGRTLQRGQLLGGVRNLARIWFCSKSQAARRLATFAELEMIEIGDVRGRQAPIITVTNWDQYQVDLASHVRDASHQRDAKRDAKRDATRDATRDNLKKETNKQQNNPPTGGRHARPADIAEVEDFWAQKRLNGEPAAFWDHFTSNGWKVGGRTPMRDWHAAARQWSRREAANGKPKKRRPLDLLRDLDRKEGRL